MDLLTVNFGPSVVGLPHEIGRPQDRRDRRANPQPRSGEEWARTTYQHAHEDCCEQEDHKVTVEKPDPSDNPNDDPQVLVPSGTTRTTSQSKSVQKNKLNDVVLRR